MTANDGRLATAHLDSGAAPFAQTIKVGHHTLAADEPPSLGGGDAGPTPYALLLASLAACTSITLRMYADKKGWVLGPVHVDLVISRDQDNERIERTVRLAPTVSLDQRERLAEIVEKTPVTKTLKRGTPITTTFV